MSKMIAASQSANQISPASERVYHQSNLIGDWKGSWSKTNLAVEFKVLNIRGNKAQVEYTHNGYTERGFGTVNGTTVSYGNVTIASRDGKNAAMQSLVGQFEMTGVLAKSEAPATDQNKLIGIWNGDPSTGQSASIQIRAISGRDAQITYTINGQTQQGIGTVSGNAVMFGKMLVSSDDGSNGKIIFPVGSQTVSIGATKYIAPSSSSSVDRLA
jgi:hypothetical protein